MRQLLIAIFWSAGILANAHAGSVHEQSESHSLADQLLTLGVKYNIRIKGIGKTENISIKKQEGLKPDRQIQYLLSNFNYLSIQNSDGAIEEIIITGKKTGGPKPVTLSTRRQGHQHLVDITLVGSTGEQIDVSMMVDTGADFVVLPESLSLELGIALNSLKSTRVQTANGLVGARVGNLEEVKIGSDSLTNVTVAFIDDNLLGGSKLLGMSVLSRYKMTIDDQQQRITLIRRY